MVTAAYKQTRAALEEHLREQVDVLRVNAAEFDAGYPHFARPISTVLRTLLHGNGALLTQLGLLDQLQFGDSGGEVDPSNLFESPRLTMIRTGPKGIRVVRSSRRRTCLPAVTVHDLVGAQRPSG